MGVFTGRTRALKVPVGFRVGEPKYGVQHLREWGRPNQVVGDGQAGRGPDAEPHPSKGVYRSRERGQSVVGALLRSRRRPQRYYVVAGDAAPPRVFAQCVVNFKLKRTSSPGRWVRARHPGKSRIRIRQYAAALILCSNLDFAVRVRSCNGRDARER